MFAGFQLNFPKTCNDFSAYQDEGAQHLESQKAHIKENLKNFIINENDGQTIDGTLLANSWFPQVKADVFLSHSHQDLTLAQGIAGWLHNKFGLNCFIDSNVWGYVDELLEILNAQYSDKRSDGANGSLYNHQKCNAASKHVNVMLTIALQRMIDKTEAVFLLSTDNAIHRFGNTTNGSTYSPWIYSEIVCSDIVRKKPLSDYRPKNWHILKEHFDATIVHRAEDQTLRVAYDVSTEHLIPLSQSLLIRWATEQTARPARYPLDTLYINTLGNEADALRDAYCNSANHAIFYCQ